jgi:hypothetical protein
MSQFTIKDNVQLACSACVLNAYPSIHLPMRALIHCIIDQYHYTPQVCLCYPFDQHAHIIEITLPLSEQSFLKKPTLISISQCSSQRGI